MKKYAVIIQETYTKEISVEAETEEEAEEILNQKRELGYDETDATINYDDVAVNWEFKESK